MRRFLGLRASLPLAGALFTLSLAGGSPPASAAGPGPSTPADDGDRLRLDAPAPVVEDAPESPPADPALADEEHEQEPTEAEAAIGAGGSRKPGATRGRAKARGPSAGPRLAKSKSCGYRSPLFEHVVVEGEHLGLIAGRYGILRADILELNPELNDPNLIRPGQKLKICPELAPRTRRVLEVVVAPGDTLGSIAQAHDLSVEELLAQQDPPIPDPNRIVVGRRLRLEVDGEIVHGFEPEPEPSPARNALRTSHRLPKGVGYAIKRPHLAYGTKTTISTIQQVIDRYHRRADGGPLLHVGDISQEGGGPIKGHVSHQRGVDVDVGLVLAGANKHELRFHVANENNLDVRRTWILVHEFLESGQVRYIFLDYRLQKLLYEHAKESGVPESELDEYFQYPRGRGRNHGIVRHWKGHRNHLHVRFRR